MRARPASCHRIGRPRSRIAGALRRLEDAIARDPGDLARRMREFRRQFHAYSPLNRALILLQCPDAIFLKGKRQWQAAGRKVKKGTRAIWIIAPDLSRGDQSAALRFIGAKVYDVADTVGPLFSVPALPPIADDEGQTRVLLRQLEAWVWASGLTLRYGAPELNSTSLGATDGMTIWVRAELSHSEKVAVLAHEIAHAKLHFTKRTRGQDLVVDAEGTAPSRDVKELQAELTAYLLLAMSGVDSCASSSAYLASWRATKAALRQNVPRAISAASAILGACERGRHRELVAATEHGAPAARADHQLITRPLHHQERARRSPL